MNLDLTNIPAIFSKLALKIKGYLGFIVLVLVLLSYGFLVFQIRNYALQSPDEIRIQEELTSLNIQKIDKASIEKIQRLEATNVEVKALFEQARNNPFQE